MTDRLPNIDALFEASIDHARSIGPPAATTRMLLQLFALRFLSTTQVATEDIWRRVRNEVAHRHIASNAASATLQLLAERVEDSFPSLKGVFSDHLLPTLRSAESLLAPWILQLDLLGIELHENASAFGRWFDKACDSVAARGASGLQYATPRAVAEMMVRLSAAGPGESVHDPCAGIGTLLAATIARRPEYAQSAALSGQEIDPGIAALARLRLFLLGARSARIQIGDVLRQPQFVEQVELTDIWNRPQLVKGSQLETFDVVLCDPPYGQRLGNVHFAEADQYRRFQHGRPGRMSSDVAFLQHSIAALRPRGRAVILIPHGPLFRSGADADVRRNMLKDDIIDAVIGLPSGTLPGLSLEPALVLCRRDKDESRAGHVLFVDASRRRGALRNSSAWNALADEIVSICIHGRDVPSFARVVTISEIESHGFSLQPRRYAAGIDEKHSVDVRVALTQAAAHETEAMRHAAVMDQLADELDASHVVEEVPEAGL